MTARETEFGSASCPSCAGAGPAPRAILARAALALLVKTVLLAALYLLCFSPSHRPPIDARSVAERVLSQPREKGSGP